jgi:hypothetical protein
MMILLTSIFSAYTLLIPSVFAASSEVIWTDYKDYHDIKSANGGNKKFRDIVFWYCQLIEQS